MEFNQQFYQYSSVADAERKNQEKYKEFKERISRFEKVDTIEAAKALAKEILPTANEINMFDIGNAKCVIINREDCFRISLDSNDEFICYDFVPKEK